MMTHAQLIQLKLKGDATVYFTEAKNFIEKSIWDILIKSGAKRPALQDSAFDRPLESSLFYAADKNFDKMPNVFLSKKDAVLRLLKEFHRIDQPLNFHEGERHDYDQLLKKWTDDLDQVLSLLR